MRRTMEVFMETVYLIQMYDPFTRRLESVGNPPEDGLFPSSSEAEDWIDQNIAELAGETRRSEYRILPLEIGVPYCEYCGVRPTCGHHIMIPTSPRKEGTNEGG